MTQFFSREKLQVSVNVQRLLQNIELYSLLSRGRASVVSSRDERLKFNSPRASSETFAILVGLPPTPGLLPPCPANRTRSRFSQRDPHFVFKHRVPERRGIIIVCPQQRHSRDHELRLVRQRLNYHNHERTKYRAFRKMISRSITVSLWFISLSRVFIFYYFFFLYLQEFLHNY